MSVHLFIRVLIFVPDAPPPTTRERPPGCRTIFVGGLPDNITEEILREMFENCGVICSIRVSKKNFAHIRYEAEESVENSLYLSGALFHPTFEGIVRGVVFEVHQAQIFSRSSILCRPLSNRLQNED